MDNDFHVKRRPDRYLLVLCAALWIIAVSLVVYGLWLFFRPGSGPQAGLALVVALFTAAAGLGLYRERRWGVALFGALGLVGSVNHIANAVQRFTTLYNAEPATAVSGVISVLGAFLIPIALIYLVLTLWRQAR